MDDLRVAARRKQDHRWRLEVVELETRSHEVPLHVIDSDKGELPCPSRRLAERVADEERPDQPRPGGGCHAIEIVGMHAGV